MKRLLFLSLCLLLAPETALASSPPAPAQLSSEFDEGLARELEALRAEDDKQRKEMVAAVKAVARRGLPAMLAAANDWPERDQLRRRKLKVATRIKRRLRKTVAAHGWPGRSLVGEGGAETALELVRRVDQDVEFQRWCLDQVEQARAAGEVPGGETFAQLVDEVLIAEGKKQRYGTALEFNFETWAYHPKPIEDEANLDARRATVGLPSLEAYLAALNAYNQEYLREKGQAAEKLRSQFKALLNKYKQNEATGAAAVEGDREAASEP